MLKILNIKKEYLLIGGSVLFFLVCYRFSFSHTVDAWKLRRELQHKITQAGDLTYQPGYLERKDNNLNHIIARFKIDTASMRSNMITTIALQAEKLNVKLSSVPVQPSTAPDDKYILQRLDFEGDFFSLCKLLQQLQSTDGTGLVRSVDFVSGKVVGGNTEAKVLGMRVFVVVVR
jgi:hypothetical protein